MISAWSAIHELSLNRELPKSSRAAVAVEEVGFHSAIVPSQVGMVDGATKTLERKPTGQTR